MPPYSNVSFQEPDEHAEPPTAPWSQSAPEITQVLGVDVEQGLTAHEASQRLAHHGPNALKRLKQRSILAIALDQFKSLIVALLAMAAVLSLLFAQWLEAGAILVVLAINALIGFFTELKATRSMEALFKLTEVKSRVLRDNTQKQILAQELVPGDVVLVEQGDLVMADLRLIEASNLEADESTLTGESAPVAKSTSELSEDVVLAERTNMLFKGTAVTKGTGVAVVVQTGMATELGQITSLVQEAESERTPLEHKLDKLGNALILLTLAIATLVVISGILGDKDLYIMVETGIALAVAAVPEGLPIVATIALAQGIWRMTSRNALVRRLSAVETLGEANVICVDKTGTITRNHMTLNTITTSAGQVELDDASQRQPTALVEKFLEIGALCNNASLDSGEAKGDPIEIALLEAAQAHGIDIGSLLSDHPQVREVPFDPDVKMMASFHSDGASSGHVAVKGAPEAILEACTRVLDVDDFERPLTDEMRENWHRENEALARSGLRILALAYKNLDSTEDDPYKDLVLIGLGGFLDPPREGVREAIESCKNAGLQLVMVTGDQPDTALAIAEDVGLPSSRAQLLHGRDFPKSSEITEEVEKQVLEARILARFTPIQKLDLIEIHQRSGSVVAMTGDGVNDAPALKKADIGIAMGLRGTQVAEEAAEMILKDDAFGTIVEAIRQGRVIFSNIRKFILYLLSCNLSEILIVGLATLFISGPLPLLPLQILFLNLVTDVFPALALGLGPGDEGVLTRPPRDPDEPIVTRTHWLSIGAYGLLITLAVLTAFGIALYGLELQGNGPVTISFLTLAFAQLWHVVNMRAANSRLLINQVTHNPYVWGALLLCITLTLLAIYVHPIAVVLHIEPPSLTSWLLILGMSFVPVVGGSLLKLISRASRD